MDSPTNNTKITDLKEYKRQWRLKKKQHIKEYNAKYYEANRDTILKYRAVKQEETGCYLAYQHTRVYCICEKELWRSSLYIHRKTCRTWKNHLLITSQKQNI